MHETLSQLFSPQPFPRGRGNHNQVGGHSCIDFFFPVRFRKRITLNDGYFGEKREGGGHSALVFSSSFFSARGEGECLFLEVTYVG